MFLGIRWKLFGLFTVVVWHFTITQTDPISFLPAKFLIYLGMVDVVNEAARFLFKKVDQ